MKATLERIFRDSNARVWLHCRSLRSVEVVDCCDSTEPVVMSSSRFIFQLLGFA